MIERLMWKEETVLCLNTNARSVIVNIKTGHWSNSWRRNHFNIWPTQTSVF